MQHAAGRHASKDRPLPDHHDARMGSGGVQDTPRRNFRNVDWEEFRKTLKTRLQRSNAPTHVQSTEDLKALYAAVMSDINAATEAHVPFSKPCPYQKRWWSPDLKPMVDQKRRMGRRAHRRRSRGINHPCIEQYKEFTREFERRFQEAKDEHWRLFLQEIDTFSVFKASCIVLTSPTDYGRTRVPAILDPERPDAPAVLDNAEKSRIFFNSFFAPPAQLASLQIPSQPDYPPPAFTFKAISNHQVDLAIWQLAPHKAPGPNGIPNIVFVQARELLAPVLGKIFRGSMKLNYMLPEWRVTKTVVLHKPGKDDYRKAKSYRPITLKNCDVKILTKCVAMDFSQAADQFALLSPNMYGSLKGRMAADALHVAIAWIKDALRQQQAITFTIPNPPSARQS